jgi:hypothetical protein
LPGGPEESHNLNQHSQCHDQDSNWAPSEYKSGALPLEPTYSVVQLKAHLQMPISNISTRTDTLIINAVLLTSIND